MKKIFAFNVMETLQNYNENEFYSQQKDIMIIMIIDFF